MERSKLFLAVVATLAAACETPTAPNAPGAAAGSDAASSTSATTFSGDATVVQTQLSPPLGGTPIVINLVETGKLPESGGALDATLLEVNTKDPTGILELGARVGHASTVGQGKRSRAEATVADLSIDVGGNTIEATFLRAVANAVCDAVGAATATGSSKIADLVINGTSYSVGTQPDQVIVNLEALRVVANEQTRKPGNANDADITVNALHVTAYAVDPVSLKRGDRLADVIIASAHADIHCGLCTHKGDDFTTGGGWFDASDPPAARKHFAVAGGFKNGGWWGHLTYMDKAENLRVKGDAVTFYENPTPGKSIIHGRGHADGRPVGYIVTVEDKGEPGDADTFEIELIEHPYPYHKRGVLGGGNIQFHDKPSRCAQ